MSARSKARKRALDVLYEADLRGLPSVDTLARRIALADPPIPGYAVELVEGVDAHAERIDALIAAHSEGWSLDRMPPVDRTALRIGVYELMWRDDIPDPVAVSEAVALVKDLSTDESPRFVNGLLGRLLADKPALHY